MKTRFSLVVVNGEGQHSIWPDFKPVPQGWDQTDFRGLKKDCLEHIAQVWTDMRPLSTMTGMGLMASSHLGARRAVGADSDVLLRFDLQARTRPEAVAVICGNSRMTYGQLHRRSLEVAAHLRWLGMGPNMIAGIRLERDENLVAVILAVLRVRAAYLPLNLSLPAERLEYMLENSEAAVLLTISATALPPNKRACRIAFVDDSVQVLPA